MCHNDWFVYMYEGLAYPVVLLEQETLTRDICFIGHEYLTHLLPIMQCKKISYIARDTTLLYPV